MAPNKKKLRGVFFYLGLIIFLIFITFPFFIMIMVALKSTNEAIQFPPTLLPKEMTLEHFKNIFDPKIFPFLSYFKNSMYISSMASAISVGFGIFGGYSLSKMKFIGKTVINNSFYTVYMFSGILLVVPLFRIISSLGLYNHRESLIIAMIVQTLPTSIYMLKSYFDTIPVEIEEAGRIDGLSRFQLVIKIIMPLSISGIVSVFVYAFMVAWNDYLFASIFLSSSDLFTLSIGLNSLFNRADYIWGRMMAAALVTSIPVVLMYASSELLMRKGSVEGGVKG
ncbi:MAG: sugar ABC transporter permease [Firmicutes bacterium HGW-Firmicutes-5]|nr:MAG: sugar ABC transporter permease [Firmicutes bacterium HGW-Firmicutes-5]